ncbi:hypothetical protein BRAS3843_770022 [Bradyrhizobium sp. STM 3843]|uniref:hypothetical protein n=1 Tax=Bradyrhizobium sp. STM 3843 TaxID=551947 RepID=UPI0002404A21|nr:hypothetical protein [Bradyrhizobium sp. STM 3843]CCE11724.1 hypothetical protein BRAS3843_770022 [Bradyrhizobium sp. STM 3843]
MPYQARYQGDEPGAIKAVDSTNDLIILKLRTMLRAAPQSMDRYQAELRELQRKHVDDVEAALREIRR